MRRTKKLLSFALITTLLVGSCLMADASGAQEPAPAKAATAVEGVKTTVAGSYQVASVEAVAITTPVAEIAAAMELPAGQTATVMAYDVAPKASPAAYACLEAATKAWGGEIGTVLTFDFGVKKGAKFETVNTNGKVGLKAQLPKKLLKKGATYAVVMVQPGGKTTVLKATVDEKGVISFDGAVGLATYAIVVK